MAYNYLDLVNKVAGTFNEVPLTSGTFNSAIGVYTDIKNSVNKALAKINQKAVNWPFNHNTETVVLTPNVSRYSFPADYKNASLNTFRIVRDPILGNDPQTLFEIDYEEYLDKWSDTEENPADYAGLPTNMFRAGNLAFGVTPAPDQAYTLKYEYFSVPTPLEAYDDVPTVPELFSSVIVDGSLYYSYKFRGDTTSAASSKEDFEDGIDRMRSIYITKPTYVRSTMRF